ncbi:aldehyde dehydrogenase family protein [Rhizobium leguminosarum bv. viciae]|nr:aldehyde dehydrogenase family protein [Rhizobium leguminosarum bv. viciae]
MTSKAALEHAEFAAAIEARRAQPPAIMPHVVSGADYFEGELLLRENPSDTAWTVSGCHDAPTDLVEKAVADAKRAQRGWAALSLADRLEHVAKAIPFVQARTSEWAVRVALETAKPRGAALAEGGEVLELLRSYIRYASAPGAFEDERLPDPSGCSSVSILRPYGVFGVISPFNYPIVQAASAAIAALIAGNGVVIKTSHLGPWSGHAVYEMCKAMDLPVGLVNIVHGEDKPGKALVAGGVDGVSFTGSVRVGMAIINYMNSGAYPRPVIAEMGGKNPVIVTDDADLEAAAAGIVFSAFDLSGQKCSALSRVLVTPGAHDRLVERVVEKASAIAVGAPEIDGSYSGALIDKEAFARFNAIVAQAKTEGFVVSGGETFDPKGYFVKPAVVSGLSAAHELAIREHFAPFLAICKVASFEEALEVANASDMGLTAGLYTASPDEAKNFLAEIEAGCVNVNIAGHATTGWWPGPQTFGGWKASGSTGKHALGKWYIAQFARQQARKVPAELSYLVI